MSYMLLAGESTAAGIKRVIREELESAAAQLGQEDVENRDEAIHEARKSIKKSRAALRLVEEELGETFDHENRRLRDVGRKLASFRDAAAAIEIFDSVVAGMEDHPGKAALSSIRRVLNQHKQRSEQGTRLVGVLGRLVTLLGAMNKRVEEWPLEADGFPVIAKGLERTFRRGRTAMATAHEEASPLDYHDWRKRVKDHWYQLILLENLWTHKMRGQVKTLKELETCLGDDHDLVLLLEKLNSTRAEYDPKDLESFETAAGHHQKELRQRAAVLGREIYHERPADFVQRVGKRWNTWQKRPLTSSERKHSHSSMAR